MDRFELAWAAGFFDGEGWANAVGQDGRKTRQPQARINQADPHGIPEVLLRFQRAVGGLGRIAGPYVMEGREDLYRWEISSRADVELLHHLLLPCLGEVKLKEFAIALGRRSATSRRSTRAQEWRAWAAGLFDGEGWFSMYEHRSHPGYLAGEVGVGQSCASGEPEVLQRFLQIIGCGRIYGPYAQPSATMPVYRWKARTQRDIESVADTLQAWLGVRKRDDANLVLEILRGQPTLPRGRPDWGNRKTHCIRGHEYATSRIRPYRSRGKDAPPRDSHQCLVCAREQARARRRRTKAATDDGRRSISE